MSKKPLFRLAVLVTAMMCAFGAAAAEAYACTDFNTQGNATLTFYYDNDRSSHSGITYVLNAGEDWPRWIEYGYYVKHVVFAPSFAAARPTSTSLWFGGMSNLESITGLSYLNTSEVTNMSSMFSGCYALTSLDLSNFNTSQVTSMESMFNDCGNLTSLDLSSFNTSQVTNMSGMFNACWALTSVDLSSFNTSLVIGMGYMFNDCWALTSLDLGSFNTSQVTNMEGMFEDCTSLHTICVGSGWSTDAVYASEDMGINDSRDMFYNCKLLVGGKGTPYDFSYVDKTYAHIDGRPSNPGYLTDVNAPVAYACYTPENTTLTFYYDKQRLTREGTTYSMNVDYNDPRWYTDDITPNVTQVVFDPSFANARPTSTYTWFYGMQKLESITGLSYMNTSEVTNMAFMFADCRKLTNLDVSHFNTSKVTNMKAMFNANVLLTSLDLSSFNTSKVSDMEYMFHYCLKLQTIYVGSGWSTSAVTTTSSSMFTDCTSLKGGQGTTYDTNRTGKAYAHIDGGTSNPGYFTAAAGVATNVEVVPAKTTTVNGIYTLDGRKLNELPTKKGVYIVDGRQVVIK